MTTPDIMSSTENLPKISSEIFTSPDPINIDDVDVFNSPTWLTRDYLEQYLRVHHKDSALKILNWSVRPALGKGENYGGLLTRIRAEYKTATESIATGHYIVKTSFEGDPIAREIMKPFDIFSREMSIYQTVLPRLNQLLREIGDDEQIFAETMAVDRNRSALIFEDLSVRNYTMPDRLQGLDMALIKIVIRKLAKMHATSAVLNQRDQGCLEIYDRGFFNRHTDNYAPGFEGLLMACVRRVGQWDGYDHYVKKLAKLKPIYNELGKRIFDATLGHINVLAHGDLWTNNVMVKYDKKTGAPLDVIIIDFQYTAWGSPALDLFYLFNTSLEEDMHLHRQDELIQYYYNIFSDTLRKLKYNDTIPSLRQFHVQLEEKAFYAFHSTCVVLPVQRNEETEDADFRAIMEDNERGSKFKDTCFRNPKAQRIIKKLLPMYERRGLLDYDQ